MEGEQDLELQCQPAPERRGQTMWRAEALRAVPCPDVELASQRKGKGLGMLLHACNPGTWKVKTGVL